MPELRLLTQCAMRAEGGKESREDFSWGVTDRLGPRGRAEFQRQVSIMERVRCTSKEE